MDIYFYEAFEAEAETLKSLLGDGFSYDFTADATHEVRHADPPAAPDQHPHTVDNSKIMVDQTRRHTQPEHWVRSSDCVLSGT